MEQAGHSSLYLQKTKNFAVVSPVKCHS